MTVSRKRFVLNFGVNYNIGPPVATQLVWWLCRVSICIATENERNQLQYFAINFRPVSHAKTACVRELNLFQQCRGFNIERSTFESCLPSQQNCSPLPGPVCSIGATDTDIYAFCINGEKIKNWSLRFACLEKSMLSCSLYTVQA